MAACGKAVPLYMTSNHVTALFVFFVNVAVVVTDLRWLIPERRGRGHRPHFGVPSLKGQLQLIDEFYVI